MTETCESHLSVYYGGRLAQNKLREKPFIEIVISCQCHTAHYMVGTLTYDVQHDPLSCAITFTENLPTLCGIK